MQGGRESRQDITSLKFGPFILDLDKFYLFALFDIMSFVGVENGVLRGCFSFDVQKSCVTASFSLSLHRGSISKNKN